jgi:GTP-binding protein Era
LTKGLIYHIIRSMSLNNNNFRTGYATIIGKPNVGKSTLLNKLLAVKISAVTPKPQTTRKKVVAIYNDEESQIIFFDTPGIFEPNYELQKIMVKTAIQSLGDAEIILYMIDAKKQDIDRFFLKTLERVEKPVFLIINKIDLVDKNIILPLIAKSHDLFPFKEIIPISALKDTNTDDVITSLKKHLPVGPPLYPQDTISSQPERFFVSETIREKIFIHFGEEIPYNTAVYIEEFREAEEQKKAFIRAIIIVERDSHKKIIIGKRGEAVKNIGISARKDIEHFLGRPIFLELFVKTKKKWRENIPLLRDIGYLS